jgi:hypothetical protein
MRRKLLLFAAVTCSLAAQPATLRGTYRIGVKDQVLYFNNLSNPNQFATQNGPVNLTPPADLRTFMDFIMIADVVSLNGRPAKGTLITTGRLLPTAPVPLANLAIADIQREFTTNLWIEIQRADGSPVGTLTGSGLGGGPAPPRSPDSADANGGGNIVITGGTGAFLGARGQAEGIGPGAHPILTRLASMAENPAMRRLNGGGTFEYVVGLEPPFPEILDFTAADARR